MFNAFKNNIENNMPYLKKAKILIAVSGGLDSVVLTHLCSKLNLNIALAHCNFNLRGNESDTDEAFVLELAKTLDIEAFVQHFNTEAYAKAEKSSIQMAARTLRYNWFFDLARQLQFDYILTAHHADDNLETVLINLTRGTGIEGLTGIPERNENIVRPLLKFSRESLEYYAKSKNIAWREDSSNASTKYLRNKLRHDVIPILKEINPTLLKNVETTLDNLKDTKAIVQESVSAVLKRAIIQRDSEAVIYKIQEFKNLKHPKAYLFEVFKTYGFTDWNVLENLLHAQSGKQIMSNTHTLLKNRETLVLTENTTVTAFKEITIEKPSKSIEIANGLLSIERVEKLEKNTKSTIYLDQKLLNFPLKVRQWEKGDYFYPLGMTGKKKLSKFFKDEKLSLRAKEKCLVLISNNTIVWVINYRSSALFKATYQTDNILKITYQQ